MKEPREKEHTDPILKEVHQARKKVWQNLKGKSDREVIQYFKEAGKKFEAKIKDRKTFKKAQAI